MAGSRTEYQRAYRARNRERIRAIQRAYRERIRAQRLGTQYTAAASVDPGMRAFLAWVTEDMARRDLAELEMRRFAVPFLARKEETP
jgi:hypothetical protein